MARPAPAPRRAAPERRADATAVADRPREKLHRSGAGGLGDNELLAIVLGHGHARTSALALATEVLRTAGGIHELPKASTTLLGRIPGIGHAKAAAVVAAVELGRRTLVRHPEPREPLSTPGALGSYLVPQFGSRSVEQFGVVLLDTKLRLLKTLVLSVGTVDASLVHPREVFREAAIAGAAAVVLFHNHPSGDPTPSRDDLALTERLATAGVLMGIPVIDHLILAETRYCSLKQLGKI